MKTLYAEFTVKPGGEVRVAEMMRDLTEHVRLEPGNLSFNPYTRMERPNEYFVFEIYRDDEAFRSHISADHSRRFNEELAPLIEGDALRSHGSSLWSKRAWVETCRTDGRQALGPNPDS